MTSNWTAFNSGEEQYNIPIQLTITKYIPIGTFNVKIFLPIKKIIITFYSLYIEID